MLLAQLFVLGELAREEPQTFTQKVTGAPSSIWKYIAPGGGTEAGLGPALIALYWKAADAFQGSTREAWRFWGAVSLAISIAMFLIVCIRKTARGLDIADSLQAGAASLATLGTLLVLKGCWFLVASGYRYLLS